MKHLILTRMGLGKFDPAWFERKIPLFAAATVSSLRGQTSQNFEWLILVDVGMPDAARAALDEAIDGMSNAHVVNIDTASLTSMRLGSFDWVSPKLRSYVLGRGIIVDPTDYYLSSLIDDDDAWHKETVSLMRVEAERARTDLESRDRRPWVLNHHSSGAVLNYTRGINWYPHHDVAELSDRPFQSMSIFVVTKFSSGISACSCRHTLWPDFARIMDFDAREIKLDQPMWVYLRHADTLGEWKQPAQSIVWNPQDFGIDLSAIERWRSMYSRATEGTNDFNSLDQYNRQYQLTALNEQLAALLEVNADGEVVARTLRRRATLLEAFRRRK